MAQRTIGSRFCFSDLCMGEFDSDTRVTPPQCVAYPQASQVPRYAMSVYIDSWQLDQIPARRSIVKHGAARVQVEHLLWMHWYA